MHIAHPMAAALYEIYRLVASSFTRGRVVNSKGTWRMFTIRRTSPQKKKVEVMWSLSVAGTKTCKCIPISLDAHQTTTLLAHHWGSSRSNPSLKVHGFHQVQPP